MTKILTTTLGTTLYTWLLSFGVLFVLARSLAVDDSVSAISPAATMSFGLASLVGLFVFGSLMFRGYTRTAPPASSAPIALVAPIDQGSFAKDLGVAVGFGGCAGVVAYLLLEMLSPHSGLALLVPSMVGVVAFLGVLFRRLVNHMFPAADVPAARALKKRPAR